MTINILTIFPTYFESALKSSIVGRALSDKKINLKVINIRDFAQDKHHTTDDRPYGGGPGMVMKIEPIDLALQSLGQQKQSLTTSQKSSRIVLMSAKGKAYDQQVAKRYSALDELTLICGHYEGIDERVTEHLIDDEVRIGDYVLTGGEPAAMVIIDSVIRLLPGVLGNEKSTQDESHTEPGLLGFPQYTRPENYREWRVPRELLSGHHSQIEEWRKKKKG